MSHNILKDLQQFKQMADKLGDLTTLASRVANEVINNSEIEPEQKSKLRKIDFNTLASSGMNLEQMQNEIKKHV